MACRIKSIFLVLIILLYGFSINEFLIEEHIKPPIEPVNFIKPPSKLFTYLQLKLLENIQNLLDYFKP